MTVSEMVNFLGEERVHMKQGIFLDVQQSFLLHSNISFDEVHCLLRKCNVDSEIKYGCLSNHATK